MSSTGFLNNYLTEEELKEFVVANRYLDSHTEIIHTLGLESHYFTILKRLFPNIPLKKKNIELINIYVPNGNPVDTEKYEYKKEWLKKFISNVKKKIQKNSNILIAGDFNIIPEEIDVHDFKRYENDALGRLEIRKKYRELINLGFKDVYRFKNKTKQEYTFWDYFAGSWQKNYGMRIDHFLLSNSLIENIKSININKKPRSKEKPSDHTPIELEII